ncbi:MAG: hypothetical protein JJE19_01025 [Methanosarcinales archaeon]|nr:hypothetical protein [Methanosarcinales archaeon]
MDELIKKRLIISKRLYTHGELHGLSSSSMDRMLAIHHFDNSVEITLKNILLKYGIKTENELKINFDTLWASVNNYGPFRTQNQKLPYESEMKGLRTVRNRIQHHADVPSSEDVDKYRIATRAFLESVFDEYFEGVNFPEISSLDWIEGEWIRKRLTMAYECISREETTEALKLAYSGLAGFRKRLADYFLPDIGKLSFIGVGQETLTEIFLKAFEKVIFCNHRAVLSELSRTTIAKQDDGSIAFAPNIEEIANLEEVNDNKKAQQKIDEITSIIDTFQGIYQGVPYS